MKLPIRCMAASCGHRFESTAAAILADGRCPRCASTDIDVDEGGLEATAAEVEAHGECQRCHERKVLVGGGAICQECSDAIKDGKPLRPEGAIVQEPAAIAMDPASEVNQETARCAFCMKTYAYRSADPTEPVPACPHCGSTATTPAGAAGGHTAADTGCNTCGHPWSEHTYGFTSNASGRCDGCHACDREKGGGHTALLLRTAAKIEEIALSVKASNPGMSDQQAVSIANETVRRYPKVVAAKYQAWEIDASNIREGDQLLDGIESVGTFAGPASSQFSSGGDGWTAVLLLEDGSAERRNFGYSEKVRVLRVR